MTRLKERQYGAILDEIRADHVGRYEWAATIAQGRVLDLACGCGYGAHILAESGCRVTAVDKSVEAISYAKAQWAHERVVYCEGSATLWAGGCYDWIVSFETLEHLTKAELFLRRMRAMSPNMLVSVPNQEAIPFRRRRFPFHVRHYTPEQFADALHGTGWEVVTMYSQKGKTTRELDVSTDGRTLIAHCVGM